MRNYIKPKVDIAISKLLECDQYLLSHDLNERTIAHKLAVYLQEEFNEYNVDCEYNKNVDEESKKKMIYILEQECQKIKKEFNKDITVVDDIEYMGLSTFPDIVIHKRGENSSNLLIIEIKKSTNRIDRCFDLQKLKCYTDSSRYNNLCYAWGLFIEFETGRKNPEEPGVIWYKDGQRIKD
ncbi:hypothetical protein MHB77_23990 [Paenibacillus sp. FSL K6-3166]|jgi:hypothetical protein|uniref:hypothetical protein n=1 Tax=unclassified Paenibacillus TaxID=185978 RepID=UPI000BA1131A|nr:hypothetical protein [Paenibacillus sp. VTT E-133291]OZQ88571.1 hypothetical protein CA598_15220 [Paenibacillus sp. VTT E-133291]